MFVEKNKVIVEKEYENYDEEFEEEENKISSV